MKKFVEQEAIMGLGHGYSYLKIVVLRSVFTIISLSLFAGKSVFFLAWVVVLANYFSWFLVSNWVRKNIYYSINEQLSDILPSIVVCTAIVIGGVAASMLDMNMYALLLVQAVVSILIGILISVVIRSEAFWWILYKMKHVLGMIRQSAHGQD